MALAQKISSATGTKNPVDSIIKKENPAQIPSDIYEKYGAYYRIAQGASIVHLDPETASVENELIYIHGGGYTLPMTQMHWGIIDRLAQATNARVTIPQYLRAPEHTAADAYQLLDAVYSQVEEKAAETGGKIIISGDSAGAALALAYAMNRRDRSLSTPDQLILFSPWVDAALENPEIASIKDPMLNRAELVEQAKKWAGEWDSKDPRISPSYGRLENLPQTLIYQGKNDLLYPDVRDFACRAVAAGSPVRLTVAPTGFHVYVALPYLPESRIAYREISQLFTS